MKVKDLLPDVALTDQLISEAEGSRSPKHGGRAMQRVWLTATALGLAFSPHDGFALFTCAHQMWKGRRTHCGKPGTAHRVMQKLPHLLPIPEDHADIMLFRLAQAEPPTVRSLRRALDEILMFC